MRRKTGPEKAKDAAAEALTTARRAVDDVAHSDVAARAADTARAAEARLTAGAREAAAAVEQARGRRRRRAAKAQADAVVTEAMSARQQLEAALVEQARHAANTAQNAAETTAESPVGRRARRATKAAVKDAKAAAKAQRKARGPHPVRRTLVLVAAGGVAALAASEDLRSKVKAALGGTPQAGSTQPVAPPTRARNAASPTSGAHA